MLNASAKTCRTSTKLQRTCSFYHTLTQRQQNAAPSALKFSRACFASAADAASKGGQDAKKEAKKSALQTLLSAVKVMLLSVPAV